MKKELEDYLWGKIGCAEQYAEQNSPSPRMVIEEMLEKGMISNHKQACRTLEKWSSKGKYDYGCSLDLGWKIDIKRKKNDRVHKV